MKKITLKILLVTLIVITAGIVYLFTYVPPLSEQHGIVETKLYLGDFGNQPMIVAFGGGGGCNDWARTYLKSKRDSLNQKGFALLAIGYFNSNGTPKSLDRISLEAIRDTIISVAQHPTIGHTKIILMGGSRGAELALNLASRFFQWSYCHVNLKCKLPGNYLVGKYFFLVLQKSRSSIRSCIFKYNLTGS